jgi:hypothetical protein
MADISCALNPEGNKWFLVLTNLSYLLPAGVTAYKMFKPNGRQMNKQDGTELIALFVFLTFFGSWSYHSCRADLSISSGIDICEDTANSTKIKPCEVCPETSLSWVHELPGSSEEKMTYEISRFIDHFAATFTLLMVVIHVIPISEKLRKLIMIIAMIWMLICLSGGNEGFATIPALLSVMILLLFWFSIRTQKETGMYTRNKAWSLAIISTALALVFFEFQNQPYWLYHSLWHILGAVGAAFLISKTAGCYEDVDTSTVKLSEWMKNIFITPNECKQYDKIVKHQLG